MKIGCFSLPYRKFPFERALEGIAQAGFTYVGVWPNHQEDPIFAPQTGQDARVAEARRAVEAAGLKATVLFGNHAPLNDEEMETFRIKIEQAAALGCDELLAWGPWPWKTFLEQMRPDDEWDADVEAFFRYLPQIARAAQQAGVTVAYKPHCGVTASSQALARIVERGASERIRVSYDGGNVSFYEGLDPAEDIKPVASMCSSLIVKDHVGGRGARGFPNVGEGAVDHKSMMATLYACGFAGPVSVEKIVGETLGELDDSAAAACWVLNGYLAEITADESA